MASSARLVFSGIDGIEAEDFVYHVRQRALTEGKLQDKQWILNFATTCFIRDALRWYASLDETIQDDWPLLQKALLARFRPVFKGIDGEECENFVTQLYQSALNEGKERDNDWLVGHALASFVGDARRWYATLDPEVQDNWKMLQRAMFERWPAPEFREESAVFRTPSYTVPFAAAASAVPAAPAGPRKGRIRIDADQTALNGYLSVNLDKTTYFVGTKVISSAMQVQFAASTHPHDVNILNATGGWQRIGLRWSDATPNLTASSFRRVQQCSSLIVGNVIDAQPTSHGRFVGITGTQPTQLTASWATAGTIHATIWKIDPDGTIRLTWESSSGNTQQLSVFVGTDNMWITGAQSKYHDNSSYCQARLVFEPL